VEEVQRNYNGDPNRAYLTGFSYGGNGVLDFSSDEVKFWAACWAVDPTKVPARKPRSAIWLSRGEYSRDERFLKLLNLRPAQGDSNGDRLYSDHGENHPKAARSAYGDDRIFDWLLTKHL